jgi:hypothetical protein
MSARQNGSENNVDQVLNKKIAEFVVVDHKTQRGYLTFYRIDEGTANAIIAAAELIFRNCTDRAKQA